jgi:8-oxo-dGTP pyrophosphatase MutT (NUDIX family)
MLKEIILPENFKMNTRYPVSAGGVVYRINPYSQILICGRISNGSSGNETEKMMWHLPKGTPEPGESIEQTALREVHEETGYLVSIDDYLGTIKYTFKNHTHLDCEKTVYFYFMNPVSGHVEDHDAEFDEVCWVSFQEALEMVEHQNEKDIILKAQKLSIEKSENNHH